MFKVLTETNIQSNYVDEAEANGRAIHNISIVILAFSEALYEISLCKV